MDLILYIHVQTLENGDYYNIKLKKRYPIKNVVDQLDKVKIEVITTKWPSMNTRHKTVRHYSDATNMTFTTKHILAVVGLKKREHVKNVSIGRYHLKF